MKKLLMFLLCLSLLLAACSCGAIYRDPEPTLPPVSCPPTVLWDGTLYYSFEAAKLTNDSVSGDMILGKITGILTSWEMPQNDGEANFLAAENAEIAEYEGELYIHYPNGYWYQLTPKDAVEQASYDCPPAVFWNGKVYLCLQSDPLSYDKIKKDGIVGKITSVVDMQGLPGKNGEANFPAAMNQSIGEYEGELYIYSRDYCWYKLIPQDTAAGN